MSAPIRNAIARRPGAGSLANNRAAVGQPQRHEFIACPIAPQPTTSGMSSSCSEPAGHRTGLTHTGSAMGSYVGIQRIGAAAANRFQTAPCTRRTHRVIVWRSPRSRTRRGVESTACDVTRVPFSSLRWVSGSKVRRLSATIFMPGETIGRDNPFQTSIVLA